jgi:rhodanese-related sulfurtransferase
MSLLSRLFGTTESSPDNGASQAVVDVREASRRQAAGALLIDVREPAEWQQGHAPGATLIPLGTLPSRLAEVPRDRDVLLICRSGNRSGSAQRQLQQLGYQRVVNVAGGMTAWSSAGLPVAR